MPISVSIKDLVFKDGTGVTLAQADTVFVVGPNNCGKTTLLRDLYETLNRNSYRERVILESLSLARQGTREELAAWLAEHTTLRRDLNRDLLARFRGTKLHDQAVLDCWTSGRNDFADHAGLFVQLLRTDDRLGLVGPVPSISEQDTAQHPVHDLYRDVTHEQNISSQFKSAFGKNLYVQRGGGSEVTLHIGELALNVSSQCFSQEYSRAVRDLAALHEQGDGMRSFTGVLLHTVVRPRPILLIDEPEAFLHPPQARYLGRALARNGSARQAFISTHSGDVLRGALDAGSGSVRILRLRRVENTTSVTELDAESVARIWTDPLLRQSNILDGLFHDKVVVCEADGDCQFFGAILQAMNAGTDTKSPDLMFTHCGGKARIPMVVRALRAVAVPTAAVFDFDLLNDESVLRDAIESFGGDWNMFRTDWNTVKTAINQKKPQLTIAELKEAIGNLASGWTDLNSLKEAKSQLNALLKKASPWSEAKQNGLRYVPNGDQYQAGERLLKNLRELGIHVVQVGELEQFYKAVGNHGPRWVNEVLIRDLKSDPELQAARDFVKALA